MHGQTSGIMEGKRGLILGVANNHSIAWGIAKMLHKHGAELAFTYQNEGFGRRVIPLAQELGSNQVYLADVQNSESLDTTFTTLEKNWGQIDFLVHALAYSDKNELSGRYVDTTRQNFL